MTFLDRIPNHAIVSEAVDLAKKRGHKGIAGFVNGVLRNVIRRGVPSYENLEVEDKLSIKYSHPKWLVKRWVSQFGPDEAEQILSANNEPALVSIRINPLKTSKESVIETLNQEGFEVEEGILSPEALVIKKGKIVHHRVFKEGQVSIQDESSMLVARALDVRPGFDVLDACAGPGGKTTHLAELMGDQGNIVALDLHEHKTKLIDDQASRLGISSIHTRAMDTRQASEEFPNASFDRLLVDAPCTGFGVIRRKPEIKYTKTEKDIETIARIQSDILDSVAGLLKPGGKLVYSTCTIDRSENMDQVHAFLEKHSDFMLDNTLKERLVFLEERGLVFEEEGILQILPSDCESDGFFIACFIKKS